MKPIVAAAYYDKESKKNVLKPIINIDMDSDQKYYVEFIKEDSFNEIGDRTGVNSPEFARLILNKVVKEITEEEFYNPKNELKHQNIQKMEEEYVQAEIVKRSTERVKNTNLEEVMDKIGYKEDEEEPINRPEISKPGSGRSISKFAEDVINVMKDKEVLFFRPNTNEIVEVGNIKMKDKNDEEKLISGFIELQPTRFITLLERYAKIGDEFFSKKTGAFFSESSMSKTTAEVVLASQIFQEKLPQITRIFKIPLPIMYKNQLTFPRLGYDERFNSWLSFDSPIITEMNLEDAKKWITEIFKEFCFNQDNYDKNRVMAIAGLLTPFLRGLYSNFNVRAPLFIYIGNRERTGKDCCAGVTGIIYEGEDIQDSPISTGEKYTNENEELRKKFTGALISGRNRMHFSNCKGHIQNSVFENILTNPVWRDRKMRVNDNIQISNEMDFSISGNAGITYTRDLAERSRFIKLFFAGENINERKFEREKLHVWVLKHRNEIISALYALVKNWVDKGSKPGTLPFTSFPEWASICGGIMESAGYNNPCVIDKSNDDYGGDIEKENMKQIYEICFEEHPNEWIKKEVIMNVVRKNEIYPVEQNIEKSKFMVRLRKYNGRELSEIRMVMDETLKRKADHSFKFVKIGEKVEKMSDEKISDEDRIEYAEENSL